MNKARSIILILVFITVICCPPPVIYAQTEDVLDNLSLQDILSMDISIAAQRNSTLRESPGIVSLITREDIKNSGAQDLIDVLRLIPGFDFHPDIQNTLSLSVYGNWANEGKVLITVDGMPLNELMYGSATLGNRVPLELVERIEIVRGSGSAQYGGIAMLAVVNIITRNAKQMQGAQCNAQAGWFGAMKAQHNASIAASYSFTKVDLSLSAYTSSKYRGTGVFTNYDGAMYDMKDFSIMEAKGINLLLNTSSTSMRLIIDNYAVGNADSLMPRTFSVGFNSVFAEIKNEDTLSSRLFLTSRLSFLRQMPWQVDVEEAKSAGLYYNTMIQRLRGSLNYSSTIFDNMIMSGGVEYINDIGTTPEETRDISYFGTDEDMKKTHLAFNTLAVYSHVLYNNPIANITLSARYENNSSLYDAFTPRIAVTKRMGSLHTKVLFSRAFRAPLIQNLSLNSSIQPEHSNIAEAEVGYQFSDNLFARANVFSVTIEHPILYVFSGATDSYINADPTGSYGIEAELHYKTSNFGCKAGYSTYARKSYDNDVYAVPNDSRKHLGIADYKITLNANARIQDKIWLTFAATGFGERIGYVYDRLANDRTIERFAPTLLTNVTLRVEDILSTGLDARIGVYNLFNTAYSFVAAYSSPSGQVFPLPDMPRMLQVQLQYHLAIE